jgi:hypothetical protein
MPLLLKRLLYDATKETDGVWFDFEAGSRLKIARANNPKWQEWFRIKGERDAASDEDVELTHEEWCDLFAKTALTDWDGLEEETGVPLECTEETRYSSLFAYKELFDFVLRKTQKKARFRVESKERDEKN